MKAIAYFQNLPATDPQSLQDITAPDPVPGDHDLLVEVKAISVNPVDVEDPRQPQAQGRPARDHRLGRRRYRARRGR